MLFFVGLHQPHVAGKFARCMVSVKRIQDRRSDFPVNDWIMDSGAFTEIRDFGRYRSSVEEYAAQVNRWMTCGNMLIAVSQDWMCEPIILKGGRIGNMKFAGTGLTVADHQRLTIERYDALKPLTKARIMPVLQGYWPEEYVDHLRQYGDRLSEGQWVGVGSVCKRNVNIEEIEQVLMAIHRERPDLHLHGFGVKTTALASSVVRDCLYSADSMAWSFAARRMKTDANDWRNAEAFVKQIESQRVKRRAFSRRLF